jgi:hypothetical protein
MRKVIFYTSIALVYFCSCRKPTEKLIPTVQLEPVLTFESLNKSNVKAFGDSLVFTVSYTDGDGDLGDFNSKYASIKTNYTPINPYNPPPPPTQREGMSNYDSNTNNSKNYSSASASTS